MIGTAKQSKPYGRTAEIKEAVDTGELSTLLEIAADDFEALTVRGQGKAPWTGDMGKVVDLDSCTVCMAGAMIVRNRLVGAERVRAVEAADPEGEFGEFITFSEIDDPKMLAAVLAVDAARGGQLAAAAATIAGEEDLERPEREELTKIGEQMHDADIWPLLDPHAGSLSEGEAAEAVNYMRKTVIPELERLGR